MPTPGAGQKIVQSNDVFVDKSRGLVFLIDRLNGLDILELTGGEAAPRAAARPGD